MIFPPLWYNLSPHIALPLLSAQLKNAGFNSKVIDLNIQFFNDITSSEFIKKSIDKIEEKYNFYSNHNIDNSNNIEKFQFEEIKNFINSNVNKEYIINKAEIAKQIIKTPNSLNNVKAFMHSLKVLDFAKYIALLPYFIIDNDKLVNGEDAIFQLSYSNIKNLVFNKEQNIFFEYYKNKIEKIKSESPKFVGISVNASVQLIGGLTLAYLLKQNTDIHVNIGGNFFSRTVESLKKYPEFFDIFADSITYGEGEKSILELAKYVNKEISIDKVPNIIYKADDVVQINPRSPIPPLSQICKPDYSDIDFTKYFTPYPLLPLSVNRGCYWRKCTFCDMSYDKTYSVKNVEQVIQELEYNKINYNVRFYNLIDESVSPEFLDKLADKLIEKDLNISIDIMARLEKGFTKKLFKKLYKAGIRFIQWGIESGNERILKLINKGIDIKNRKKILKDANSEGIINFAFYYTDFPSETYKEALSTIDFIFKNRNIIPLAYWRTFYLGKYSQIAKTPDLFNIEILADQVDFSYMLNFKNNGKTDEERKMIKNKIFEEMQRKISNKFLSSSNIYIIEYLLFFLDYYGSKKIKKLKI